MTHVEESAELVARLRRGEIHVLAELFACHRGALRRMVALRLDQRLNGRVAPSDILQEAYLDAVKRLAHYQARPDMPFLVWLRLIVGQRMIEFQRQHLGAKRRDARQEMPAGAGIVPGVSSLGLAAHLAAELTSPSQAAIRNETLGQLEEALDAMDPVDREVLVLRHFEELSNNDVATTLGIQKAAASKRYVRALGRLKDILTVMPAFRSGP